MNRMETETLQEKGTTTTMIGKANNIRRTTKSSIQQDHDAKVVRAMKDLINTETSTTVLSDREITLRLREQGLWVVKGRVYDLRRLAGIPNAHERQIGLFSKENA